MSADGRVEWLCLPRFDSPSVFASLLDPTGGHWVIRPRGEVDSTRRYVDRSLVVETTFTSPAGRAVLTDALLAGDGEREHDLGRASPHAMVRSFEVVEGELTVEAEYCPRPDYGRYRPTLTLVAGGVLLSGSGTDLMLAGPTPQLIQSGSAYWAWSGRAGDRVVFTLQSAPAGRLPPLPWTGPEALRRLADTISAWQSWSALHERYDGPWRPAVLHSGRVLQALTFAPTGAVLAAATTGLPGDRRGVRNWDYRYSWLRAAAGTLRAQRVAGCPDEADRFLGWMLAAASAPDREARGLQVVYGVGGERDLTEETLGHLRGWCGSAPVRIGNDSCRQVEHAVTGELFDAVHLLAARRGRFDNATAERLATFADDVARHWREADNSLWEISGERRPYLHSKLMCWVALDRAITLTDRLGAAAAPDRVAAWRVERARVSAAICDLGWSETAGAYSQAFGSDVLDASALMLLITGFLPADDQRMLATIATVADRLSAPCGLLYRYLEPDGLPGTEATFLICTYWLVECLALVGEQAQAIALFERATAYANDVGLLAEEAEPLTGQLLGNFPHTGSHVGLLNAARAIERASAAPTF